MPQNWKTLFNEARLEKLCSLLIRLNVPNFTNDKHFSKLFQAKYNNLVYYLLRLSKSLNSFPSPAQSLVSFKITGEPNTFVIPNSRNKFSINDEILGDFPARWSTIGRKN